jgi:hypothetical protein
LQRRAGAAAGAFDVAHRCVQPRSAGIIIDPVQRQPMPMFWIVVQVAIVVCVLISAVIVIVKL